MTNNADNVSGQAPSLMPTGRQGSSSESVSILRDLDPRTAKLGASPSLPYKTILLVAAPLAVGAVLLSGYLYSGTTGIEAGTLQPKTAEPTLATTHEEVTTPPPPVAAASHEAAPDPSQEGQQGPATILAHPDTEENGTEQPKTNPLSILAEDNGGQPSASSSTVQGKTTGKSGNVTTSKHVKPKATPVRHAKKADANKVKPKNGEKKVIEHEIDIVTAIVKGSQN